MTLNLSNATIPPNFSGIVRLFPLPNLVLFPGVVQSLHIFEPRYLELTKDSLNSDHLIAMGLFQTSSLSAASLTTESKAEPICDHICVAKIVADKKIEDGKYNLLVYGVNRAKIVREISSEHAYRLAEVQLVEDASQTLPDDDEKNLRRELIETCESLNLLGNLTKHADVAKILTSDFSLGLLADLVCFTSELDCKQKQTILELSDIDRRCRALIEFLHQFRQNPDRDEFPPEFSDN